MISYSNLNQPKREPQIDIRFLELEEMSFIFSCKLNSFMHRGEKTSLDGVKSILLLQIQRVS